MLNNKTTPVNAPATSAGQASMHVQQVSPATSHTSIEERLQPKPDTEVVSVAVGDMPFYEFKEDDILRDISIEARPLVLDESYKIKPMDKVYAYRWINCMAGGIALNKALSMGWQFADPKDLLPKEQGGHRGEVKENRIYLSYDLVLMKLPAGKYAGIIKGNLMSSMHMVSSKNAVKKAIAQANQRMGNVPRNSEGQPSVEYFQPRGQDLKVMSKDGREVGEVLPSTSAADSVFETL